MAISNRYQRHMIPVEMLVEEAIDFLKCHEPPEGYFVAFSGGKDSIVTYELVKMAQVKHKPFYSFTGIDPPEMVHFLRKHYPEVTWLHPKESFWKTMLKRTPPLRTARWCCDTLKKNPALKIKLRNRVLGIRAEESAKRAMRPRVEYIKHNKQTLHKPIFHWLDWHVWEFIESRNLVYPSLYDEGFDRIGCIICPFLTIRKMKHHKARWPKFYDKFESTVHQWFNPDVVKRSPMLQRFNIQTAEQYLEFWYGFQKTAFPDANECCKARSPFEE